MHGARSRNFYCSAALVTVTGDTLQHQIRDYEAGFSTLKGFAFYSEVISPSTFTASIALFDCRLQGIPSAGYPSRRSSDWIERGAVAQSSLHGITLDASESLFIIFLCCKFLIIAIALFDSGVKASELVLT